MVIQSPILRQAILFSPGMARARSPDKRIAILGAAVHEIAETGLAASRRRSPDAPGLPRARLSPTSRTRRSSSLTYTTQPLKHTDPLYVGRVLDGAMLSLISSLPSQPPPTVALFAGKEWPSRCNTPFGICARVKLSGRGTGRFMVRSQLARLWRAGFLLSGDFGSLHGRLGPCACGPDVKVRMPCGTEN
jgi:hypothetical protein